MEDEREFRHSRDAAELALGSALADLDAARDYVQQMARLSRQRTELDGLRGALELVRYGIEGLALALNRIER